MLAYQLKATNEKRSVDGSIVMLVLKHFGTLF